ncbi:hypothetical protein GCM10009800_05980 [Nocardiopsis rhodophaea]
MRDNSFLDSRSVYQTPTSADRPRAFYVDCWDDDAEDFVHVYFGVASPAGGGIAQPLDGGGFYLVPGTPRCSLPGATACSCGAGTTDWPGGAVPPRCLRTRYPRRWP